MKRNVLIKPTPAYIPSHIQSAAQSIPNALCLELDREAHGITSPKGVLLNKLMKFRQMGKRIKAISTSKTIAADREQTIKASPSRKDNHKGHVNQPSGCSPSDEKTRLGRLD